MPFARLIVCKTSYQPPSHLTIICLFGFSKSESSQKLSTSSTDRCIRVISYFQESSISREFGAQSGTQLDSGASLNGIRGHPGSSCSIRFHL